MPCLVRYMYAREKEICPIKVLGILEYLLQREWQVRTYCSPCLLQQVQSGDLWIVLHLSVLLWATYKVTWRIARFLKNVRNTEQSIISVNRVCCKITKENKKTQKKEKQPKLSPWELNIKHDCSSGCNESSHSSSIEWLDSYLQQLAVVLIQVFHPAYLHSFFYSCRTRSLLFPGFCFCSCYYYNWIT